MEQSYKNLEQIAGRFKQLSLFYITRGPWKPAYLTGNLYNKVESSNNVNSILKTRKTPYVMVLNYSPEGATYGKYVHNGTSKMIRRPFAEWAANDKQMVDQINKYGEALLDEQFQLITTSIDDNFKTITTLSRQYK